MRRPTSRSIVLVAALILAACGSKEAIPTGKQSTGQGASGRQSSESTAAAGTSSEPAATQPAPIVPTDIPSETDDGQESTEQIPTGLLPTFKLGGPSNRPPTSARFKEGTHYQKIVPAQPTGVPPDKVEVLEVFWYGCGNCFALDPALDSWRTKLKPAYVDFIRLPAMWNEAQRLHARVFYTAELLGKLEELHALIFREVNVKGNALDNVEKIGAFFREHGVSTDEFQKAFSSVAVESKLQQADFTNRRLRVQSAPVLVINGKYRTSVEMAGGEQQLFALIGEVASHEHGG
jgi:protein dithiol oxidoreductase (disulfide-forming)